MSLEDFAAKQKQILAGIEQKGAAVREKGLVSSIPERGKCQAASLVYLRYPAGAIEQIADVSRAVSRTLHGRAVVYDEENMHQSIADYGLRTADLNGLILETPKGLIEATQKACDELKSGNSVPRNCFGRYIFSQDSVLLMPVNPGNPATYSLIEAVASSLVPSDKCDPAKFRKAWGEHITVARISENVSPEQPEVKEFLERLMGNQYIPHASRMDETELIKAESLNVGQFVLDRNAFHLMPLETFTF
jgi:hypothetical protein